MATRRRSGQAHIGIGGWSFEGWRGGAFYPSGLRASQELPYASQQLSGLEINSTFYTTPKPETWARWAAEVPPGFIFSVKAHRMATLRRELASGAESVAHFLASGITQLGAHLGPIVWQLRPTYAFNASDVELFLALLPDEVDGLPLRHVLEPRHPSFACADYLALARAYGVATVATDSPDFPNVFDTTAGFIYARLMRSQADCATGYPQPDLAQWAERVRAWQRGGLPADLPLIDASGARQLGRARRDVFVQFISGAKARNPAAAQALIGLLDGAG